MREAEEYWAWTETPITRTLDEPLALERADEPRGRRLRQAGTVGELGDGERLVALDDPDQQFRRPVDRLGSRFGRHPPILWNMSSTNVKSAARQAGCEPIRASRLAATSSRKSSGSRKNVA